MTEIPSLERWRVGNEELKAALGRTELHGVKGGVPGLPELCVILLEEKKKVESSSGV